MIWNSERWEKLDNIPARRPMRAKSSSSSAVMFSVRPRLHSLRLYCCTRCDAEGGTQIMESGNWVANNKDAAFGNSFIRHFPAPIASQLETSGTL